MVKILVVDVVLRMTPVLILTTKESARTMLELLPNVRLYMSKPFDPPELLSSIQRLLGSPTRA
jgi:DNA-binding response OmpR family regulator